MLELLVQKKANHSSLESFIDFALVNEVFELAIVVSILTTKTELI